MELNINAVTLCDGENLPVSTLPSSLRLSLEVREERTLLESNLNPRMT